LTLTAVPLSGITATTITSMIQPYAAGTIVMSSQDSGSTITGGFKYPFFMTIPFTNNNNRTIPPPLVKTVIVYTHRSNNAVGACYPTTATSFSNFQPFTTSGTFTVPQGTNTLKVEVWGGGAGGGGAAQGGGVCAGGGGGGGGAYSMGIFNVTAGTAYTV